ncbi:MAG: DUF898 family protein [Pikeienuella sp.]|uniref:DUF898 family protein n=1 Tax=Pikeienuella sp. TaxID=2831957 RepID=UPI00391DCAA8
MRGNIESSLPPNPWSAPRRPAAPTPVVYDGSRGRLFGLALGRMALTILTLGIGRFWMTTRLRRHYWASIRIDGSPLEYTGRAMEKLIGFLVAVVILAVYISLANLALTFAGLAWLEGSVVGLQLPLLALAPALFWAQYRARRYILARTRWRGVRFGLAPGAWGYAWRAMVWWGLTLLTLGLLYPLTQHRLARYTTARSYFGDLRFTQEGGAGPLMRSWLWVWLPAAGLAAAAAGFAALGKEPGPEAALAPLLLLFVALGFVRHQVFSFRHLNSLKTLAGKTRFSVSLGFWRVVGIYVSGALAIGLGVAATAAVSSLAAAALIGDPSALFAALAEGRAPDVTGLLALALLAAAYLPAVAVWSALGHAFLTHPLLKAACAGLLIHDLEAAERARQRAHDEQAEAGGFADALGADMGGAF